MKLFSYSWPWHLLLAKQNWLDCKLLCRPKLHTYTSKTKQNTKQKHKRHQNKNAKVKKRKKQNWLNCKLLCRPKPYTHTYTYMWGQKRVFPGRRSVWICSAVLLFYSSTVLLGGGGLEEGTCPSPCQLHKLVIGSIWNQLGWTQFQFVIFCGVAIVWALLGWIECYCNQLTKRSFYDF